MRAWCANNVNLHQLNPKVLRLASGVAHNERFADAPAVQTWGKPRTSTREGFAGTRRRRPMRKRPGQRAAERKRCTAISGGPWLSAAAIAIFRPGQRSAIPTDEAGGAWTGCTATPS